MPKAIDLTGQRFGRLLVLERVEDYVSPKGLHLKRWKCKCDCGNIKNVGGNELKTGRTKSCGCLVAENNRNRNLNYHYQYAKEGINDLVSQYPNLLKEWDYEKNNVLGIFPNKFSYGSRKKVWWICPNCEYEYQQSIVLHFSLYKKSCHHGCPKCNNLKKTSFPEQAIYYYVKQIFPDAINSDKHLGMELDIYISSLNVAIEYDGQAWHNTDRKIKADLRKNQLCVDNNIELIRIREPKCVSIGDCTIFNRKDTTTNLSLDIVISDILRYLTSSILIDVDTTRDTPIILSQYATKQYENSLSYCYPNIAKEWHPIKNGTLTPDKVAKYSNRKVWWRDELGHEWQMQISERTRNKSCNKNKALIS